MNNITDIILGYLFILTLYCICICFQFRLHRAYSKRNNNWTSHVEKVPKEYLYIPELLTTMFDHLIESDEPLTSPVPLTPSDPRKQKRTLSRGSPPSTKSLFETKKSRFLEESEDK